MIFTISLKGDGTAFDGQENKELETVRILRDVVHKIEVNSQLTGVLKDINGNAVGEWYLR